MGNRIKIFDNVAPFVGAWIEIAIIACVALCEYVAPFVGAWIEIGMNFITSWLIMSLPLWERGLKYEPIFDKDKFELVAPFVGAWIEII